MAVINTDRIWPLLGSFFGLFPQEERIYWRTFWESLGSLTADLWGLAFQVDRAKSPFSTEPTFERLNVEVNLSNLTQEPQLEFELVSVVQIKNGALVFRGNVPRGRRSFKIGDVPASGIIRVGVDVVNYASVNVIAIEGGTFDGYVREATFTVLDLTPHDYSDTVEFSDSFYLEEIELTLRTNHVPGALFIDATGPGDIPALDQTGRIQIGQIGVNYDDLQYRALTIIGDNYVFLMPTTWSSPLSSPDLLSFHHSLGDTFSVSRLTPSKWTLTRQGPVRLLAEGGAVFVIDNNPVATPSICSLASQVMIADGSDFDLATTIVLESWPACQVGTQRDAGLHIKIDEYEFVVGVRSTPTSDYLVFGLTTVPSLKVTEALNGRTIELQAIRTGGVIEFNYRKPSDTDFIRLGSLTVSGGRALTSLRIDDTGTVPPETFPVVRIRFDEVVRRLGETVGSTRLEDQFIVSDAFAYRYDTDVNLLSATTLRDAPRLRSEQLMVLTAVSSGNVITAFGSTDKFQPDGVPKSGILMVGTKSMVYDEVTRSAASFEFQIRGKIDPDLLPIEAGSVVFAQTREISGKEYMLPGESQVWMRNLPTIDLMWAPVAREDQRHVQRFHGPLVDLDITVSSDAYLRRVQGFWYSLMSGPAVENIKIGVQLAMGLPVARASGVVQRVFETRNKIGDLKEKGLVITGPDGTFTHYLNTFTAEQGIDWVFTPGEAVDKFDPLTDGVKVLDVNVQDNWPVLMGNVISAASPERYNTFGILVDTRVINSDTSMSDAIKFLLRIKPTYTKLLFHFVLRQGDENLHVDDDGFFTTIADMCEDPSFDEGIPPFITQPPLRMGDGHFMGQYCRMGTSSPFREYPALGIGLFMGRGLTMGMAPRAFECRPDSDNHAHEELAITPVIEVEP